ncbi:MAG: site-specific integrase [Bacteroidetes bacterium]|nr:site-specific integrase [Bacteroidota bacterium]
MNLPQIAVIHNWRNEDNKSGLYSIHLRITIERDSRYYKIPVPQKVSKVQWSGKDDNWVKNHSFAFEINAKIIEKKNLLNELIKRSYNFNKPLSFETIFKHLKKKGDSNSFYEYMQSFINNPPEKLEENTIKKYNTCLAHLKEFKKELFFSDIDNILLRDFHKFMQVKKSLQGSSCKKYMEALKRVIKCARKDNYLDSSQMEFLFDDVKIKVNQAKRTFLEIQEIKQLRAAVFPKGKEFLARDRDMFLFQIYTGYYYKDLPIFTKDQLFEDEEFGFFLIGSRDKNGNQTIIPLFKFPHAAGIIRAYQSETSEKSVFNPSAFIEEPAYNRNLKEIARIAGVKKNITNKVARHTNAQLWVRYGAERPIISKMMGHMKEETTKNYFSVNLPEIVEGTKRVDFGKLGI